MQWQSFRRSLIVVLVPVGILAGSIAVSLGALYAASLLDVSTDRLKTVLVTAFLLALVVLAKMGGWILSSTAEMAAPLPATRALRQRVWPFGERARDWIEALFSTLLAMACAIEVAVAADRHGLGTWAIVPLVGLAWIAGIVLAARLMARVSKALAPVRPRGTVG
jgi:hypothetical protein